MNLYGKVDDKALRDAIARIGGAATGAALNRALNRSGESMQTSVNRLARSVFAVKAARVKSDTKVEKARGGRHEVTLRVSGKRIRLIEFARPTQSPRSKGASVTVQKAGGRQLIPHAFIRTGKFGPAIFWRKNVGGKRVGRGPLKALAGPSVAQMVGSTANTDAILKHGKDTFAARFKHEIGRIVGRK